MATHTQRNASPANSQSTEYSDTHPTTSLPGFVQVNPGEDPTNQMFRSHSGVTPLAAWMRTNMRIRNKFITEPLAEFLGTFVICLFGVGASAQYVLMPNESYLMPVFGGVTGLLIAIIAFGGASGAHVNPVVTLCLAIVGNMPWTMVPYYWTAQFMGGYLGAGVAYAIYEHRLCVSGGQVCVEAVGIFSPLPSSPVRVGLLDQIVTVSVLMVFVFGAIDKRNMKVEKSQLGMYFAVAVGGISASFGVNAGAVLNPARDLAPRLMAITLGHSVDKIFYYGDEPYWIVPLLGPFIGGILGTFIYMLLVGSHLEDDDEEIQSLGQRSLEEDWRSMIVVPKIGRKIQPALISTHATSCPFSATNYMTDLDNNGFLMEEDRKAGRIIY